MSFRSVFFIAVLLAVAAIRAEAQTAQPYALSEVGGSFGDVGSAPAAAFGFGYLTPRNFGFEIEVSYVPDLDFGDPGIPRIAIFPPIEVNSTGRIVGLHTNVIAILPGGGTKLRAFVVGGGGVADVEQRIRVRGPIFSPFFPGIPPLPEFPFLGLDRFVETENTVSDTSLVLSAGAGFEYAVTQRFGLGMSVRYQRLFNEPRDLDMARAAVRATWRF